MTVSVAIATYNRASMVVEAVKAALAQSRVPEEIVVSDDASTDGTRAVIEDLAQREGRVRLICQARNSGGVENWSSAIAATRGNLIAWCSDDDRFLPEHLEASAAYLETHPKVGLVHSGFIDVIETADGVVREPRRLREESVLTKRGMLPHLIRYYDWPFHPSTMVMRRQVWDAVGPFDARYQFADTEWFLRVAEQFPIASLSRHGVLNRRHPGNWSNRLGSAHLQREVFEMVEGAIGRNYSWPEQIFWGAAWKANVRARLLLTLRARLRSGHAEAAASAWHGLLQDTGSSVPAWFERGGVKLIRKWCAADDRRFEEQRRDPRQRVSPL